MFTVTTQELTKTHAMFTITMQELPQINSKNTTYTATMQ